MTELFPFARELVAAMLGAGFPAEEIIVELIELHEEAASLISFMERRRRECGCGR